MYFNTSYLVNFGNLPVEIADQHHSTRIRSMCCGAHVQKDMELLYIYDVGVRVELNDTAFTAAPGDILVFSPFDKHAVYYLDGHDSAAYYCLTFDLGFFERVLPPEQVSILRDIESGKRRFSAHIRRTDAGASLLGASFPTLFSLYDTRTAINEMRMEGHLILMLCELLEHHVHDASPTNSRSLEFIRSVIGYCETHCREPISTASVCDALAYNKSYFCRRFRECFGTTFSDYLCRFRIERAAELRGKSGLSLIDIAGQAGFSDYAYFSRSFSKYMGVSPKHYFGGNKS